MLFLFICACGQDNSTAPKKELKYRLNKDGSRYLKATLLTQVWARWSECNPGTLVNGKPADAVTDIGLRRMRFQLYGQITDHAFFYTQFGLNNFNYLSQNAGNRKLAAFFHDVVVEYKVCKGSDKLKVGGGLTILNGLSRFSQPGISSIMTTDVPVFLQTTVDQTDEFARKMSVYARGQIGRVDYRVSVVDPFPVQTNGLAPPEPGSDATFTTYGHSLQYTGLFIYSFMDKEPNTTPYMAGTYLGERKILNIETGIIAQEGATWTRNGTDTSYHNMLQLGVALFADMPVHNRKGAISAYAGFFYTDYGPGYIRNNGIMNPANGNNNSTNFNGAGIAYPMFGTGNSLYIQGGYKFADSLLQGNGTLMPYVSYRYSAYDKLADPVAVTNVGINWLMNKQNTKLSLNYEQRPLFTNNGTGAIRKTGSAAAIWAQYQIFF
ncbi:MAG: hypothetical protein EBZ77_04130 [Chitinophagia bacterium]|nr:hypothetical protein [Chitinophagia bacterium]